MKILITAIGSTPGYAVAQAIGLRRLIVLIIGVDAASDAYGQIACDSWVTVPRADQDPGLFRTAMEAMDVDCIIPILPAEIEVLASSGFPKPLVCCSIGAVRRASDKYEANRIVAHAGVAVPDKYASIHEAKLPCIIKPRMGSGSHGVTIVRSELEQIAAKALNRRGTIVQRFIEGREFTVDMFVSKNGEVLAACPRWRKEVRGGQSYKGRTEANPIVANAAIAAAHALGLDGPCNVQIIEDENGTPWFIEANAKFSAGLGLTVAAGLNLPWLYVKQTMGEPIDPAELEWKPGVFMARGWAERYWSDE